MPWLQLQIRRPYLMFLQKHLILQFQLGHALGDGVLSNQDNRGGIAFLIDVDNMHDGVSYDVEDE